MVTCKRAEMFMSLSMTVGISPKVHFQCGNCGRWSAGRGSTQYVNLKRRTLHIVSVFVAKQDSLSAWVRQLYRAGYNTLIV